MTEEDINEALGASSIPSDLLMDYISVFMMAFAVMPSGSPESHPAVQMATVKVLALERKYLSDSPTDDERRQFLRHILRDASAIAEGTMKP